MVLHNQLLGIGVTYEMQNSSRYIKWILLILSGFLDNSISRQSAKKLPKSWVRSLREGVGKKIFVDPQYLPKFWNQGNFLGP